MDEVGNGRLYKEDSVKAPKLLSVTTAIAVAFAPVAASASTSLTAARAAPPTSGALHFADDESNHGGGSTAVFLGVMLIVLIAIAAISRNGDSVNNRPASP